MRPVEPRHSRTSWGSEIGLYSGFWTRFLLWLLRVLPAWICLGLTRPITLLVYALAGPQRAGVVANLKALRPDLWGCGLWWAGYRVFVQFALTYLDRLWHMHLGHELRWEVQDRNLLEEQLNPPGGILLFTVHSGNYDIGAALFTRQFGRTIHIVRRPERTQSLQELRAFELAQAARQDSRIRVHYNESEWQLGLELCQLLRDGEVVAVQGDRVLPGLSALPVEHDGLTFLLPRGPLVLAEIAKVPCVPIFLTRRGRCRYRLDTATPFYDGATQRQAEEIGRAWLAVMSHFVRQHWEQWFVFEKLVTRADALTEGD